MVRKGSSKKLLSKQQTTADGRIAKPAAILVDCEPPGTEHAAVPLDATKENLIEFCGKSRSQSPVMITVVASEQPTTTAAVLHRNATENDSIITGPTHLQTSSTSDRGDSKPQPSTNFDLNVSTIPTKAEPVDIVPPPGIDGGDDRRTTAWSRHLQMMTNNGCCSSYRRSSDVSYMLSSFRTTATMSSNLLGSDLRGLSERLQDLQLTMFEDRATDDRGPPANVSGNLHRFLLNRQQLTAVVADRKPKYKFTPMNRDVPVGSPPPASNLLYYMSPSCRSAPHSKRASPEHDFSSSTKEMLLKLFYSAENNKPAEPNVSA